MALCFAVFACAGVAQAEQACRADLAQLRGPWGETAFEVEVAETPAERAKGLMFREDMAQRAGMLFIFERPGRVSFWMKNTLIPLDMLFIDETGTVTRVHSNAVPGDLTAIDGGPGVKVVIEINGGLAKRYGIGPGTQVRNPTFGDDAVWPC
ncbi:DUF192 domain-containing protein [Chachezhania sediminis]|uniref:DUF192 domain-containing protein n=1 Tax=Chachezhania sediminis TaxID=2599291 RepID=UPI00131E385F|nr:DUF192 domain-containing protein [Chachezhania sediminis]